MLSPRDSNVSQGHTKRHLCLVTFVKLFQCRKNTYCKSAFIIVPPQSSRACRRAEAGKPYPALPIGQFRLTEVLIEVENHLERIATPEVRQGRRCLIQSHARLRMAFWSIVRILVTREWQQTLKQFVPCQRETELWRRSHYSCRPTLEESLEAFLLPYRLGRMSESGVRLLSIARLDL